MNQQIQQIPLGYDLDRILRELARIRDYYAQFPFIRRTALAVGNPKENNDLGGILSRISDFVKWKMIYVPDPYGFEVVIAPDVLLAQIVSGGTAHGDCDDHVLLLNTMLLSVGYQTAFVGVKQASPDDTYNHVISSVQFNGKWVDIDPCDKSGRNETYSEKYIIQ